MSGSACVCTGVLHAFDCVCMCEILACIQYVLIAKSMYRCVCMCVREIMRVFESTGRMNGDKSAVTAEYCMCTVAWVLAVHLFPCEAASSESK